MKVWKFEIFGRGLGQEDKNPMGYKRTTVGSKWDAEYQKYTQWCGYVRSTFEANFPDHEMLIIRKRKGLYLYAFSGKNLHIDDRYTVRTWIWFTKDVRSDAGNVTKGITDALFDEDKQVLEQSMAYEYDKKHPRVLVEISFTAKQGSDNG